MEIEDYFLERTGVTVDSARNYNTKYTAIDMCKFAKDFHERGVEELYKLPCRRRNISDNTKCIFCGSRKDESCKFNEISSSIFPSEDCAQTAHDLLREEYGGVDTFGVLVSDMKNALRQINPENILITSMDYFKHIQRLKGLSIKWNPDAESEVEVYTYKGVNFGVNYSDGGFVGMFIDEKDKDRFEELVKDF